MGEVPNNNIYVISILSENVVNSQIIQLSHIRGLFGVHSTTHGILRSTIGESINSICHYMMKPYIKEKYCILNHLQLIQEPWALSWLMQI